jgi:hypothetical protein
LKRRSPRKNKGNPPSYVSSNYYSKY